MFCNFDDIEDHIRKQGLKKRIVLCGAHDDAALSAVAEARKRGVAEGILIGREPLIRSELEKIEEDASHYEIINERNDNIAAETALHLVDAGLADIPMKGLMQTATFLWALINRERNRGNHDCKITHTTAFYYPQRDGFLFASDTSFIREPTLEDKVVIIKNAVEVMRAFGLRDIKVAVLSAIESVKENIPSTVDAQKLSEMDWGDGVVVEGPFALDNAIDPHSAEHKGIHKSVAGHADLLLMPDFLTGNVLYKSIHFFGHLPISGMVCGISIPAVVNSRSDETSAKYNSILAAILQSEYKLLHQ